VTAHPLRWTFTTSRKGNPAITAHMVGTLRGTGQDWHSRRLSVFIACGPTANHTRGRAAWGPTAEYYADLEVSIVRGSTGPWRIANRRRMVVHMERGYRTHAEAFGAAEWLRSCVEATGVAGLYAVNRRTRGEFS
jgi:hypothetical protein